jgi:hypothetical protein
VHFVGYFPHNLHFAHTIYLCNLRESYIEYRLLPYRARTDRPFRWTHAVLSVRYTNNERQFYASEGHKLAKMLSLLHLLLNYKIGHTQKYWCTLRYYNASFEKIMVSGRRSLNASHACSTTSLQCSFEIPHGTALQHASWTKPSGTSINFTTRHPCIHQYHSTSRSCNRSAIYRR